MSRARPTSIFLSFLLGLMAGTCVVAAGAYAFVSSGHAPVSAVDADFPLEEFVINRALRRQVRGSRNVQSTIAASDVNLQTGARVYVHNCAVCHGTPREGPTKIATGMYPPPPQLFHGEGVSRDAVGATYWKIAYGIRLSGMPGFRQFLTDTEIWQMTLLLRNARKLPPGAAAELDRASAFPIPPPIRTGGDDHHR